MKEETDFPLEVKSPLIDWLQKVILITVKILACMMALVIVWSVVDVGILLYTKATTPPHYLFQLEDILEVFGGFLIVLIAIEIFLNIILYLRKDSMHLRLVIATALMAISRKIIVWDYEYSPASHLYAIGAAIVALGIAYWLVQKR